LDKYHAEHAKEKGKYDDGYEKPKETEDNHAQEIEDKQPHRHLLGAALGAHGSKLAGMEGPHRQLLGGAPGVSGARLVPGPAARGAAPPEYELHLGAPAETRISLCRFAVHAHASPDPPSLLTGSVQLLLGGLPAAVFGLHDLPGSPADLPVRRDPRGVCGGHAVRDPFPGEALLRATAPWRGPQKCA
jgi:hypothetical protein